MTDSTSPQRSHRYLRIAIGGTFAVILVAVLFAVPRVGWLPSLSAYFYSPAQTALVGALIAASLALLALSGRGAERALLDAAALFAPLIAIVPTATGAGEIAGVEVECARCVPPDFIPGVENGVATYLVVLAAIIVLGLVLTRTGQVQGGGLSLAIGALVFMLVLITGLAAPDLLLHTAHFVAAVLFFALIATDVILNAFWRTTSSGPPRWLRIAYIAIAAVMMGALVVLITVLSTSDADAATTAFPWILVGEIIALIAFVTFWWLQTWQRWNEGDPASLARRERRLPPLLSRRVASARDAGRPAGQPPTDDL